METRLWPRPVAAAAAVLVVTASCVEPPPGAAGSPALRGALFDTILARTERREAWSPIKNETLDFDPMAEMRALRSEVVAADSETSLYYALQRVSNARRDRHLSVGLVPGGIVPSAVAGLDLWGGVEEAPMHAPVMIRPDFGATGGYFIADLAGEASDAGLSVGDRIGFVNGMRIDEYERAAAGHIRYSTTAGLRWKIAEAMPQATAVLPPGLRRDRLDLAVVQADGDTVSASLPYREPEGMGWSGALGPDYPGMELVESTPTFDLYRARGGLPVLLLRWYGFRETMVVDVDALMERARQDGLLDHAVIFDATASGGGSLGGYALQRLQPRPFKTTFGTLRLSDVFPAFLAEKREEFAARNVNDNGTAETVDDGTWLMQWLEEDAVAQAEAGVDVTRPVPFKLAHAPRDSDGVLQPADVHFRGPLVVLVGPSGGSHLDQFVSIVADNDLGPIIGMPAGGYSNTWEWEEVLTWPGTDRPVVGFMWSIGHTIRPNGEILEGNPADVDDWIPLTAQNSVRYHALLLERAFAHLAAVGHLRRPTVS
jgi:hypothetical protein